MAANDLEGADWLVLALVSSKECANSRSIAGEVVALALLERPLLGLLNLDELVLLEKVLAVVNSMEMAGGGVESNKDLTGILTGLTEEGLGHFGFGCGLDHLIV